MRGLTKFDTAYFEKYKTKPVKIKPFSSKQTLIAKKIISQLKEQLPEFKITYLIRGSTAFKISGKGEVEVGVYPQPMDWNMVIEKLVKIYGPLEQSEDNYGRVNTTIDKVEVEIILLKDHEANVDIKLHRYMMSNPEILKDYEKLKKDNCYSKRQYMIAKNEFLADVIEKIPDIF